MKVGELRTAGGLTWLEPPPLGGVARILVSTRLGGGSREPYDSLNLGFHVGDVAERVRLNRLRVARALPRTLSEPVVGEQVHGVAAASVGPLHAGTRWETPETALAATDALVTTTRRLPLVTLVADCAPVALADPVRGVVAAVHAGWRGLSGGVLAAALRQMGELAGTAPEDVAAWVGPCIRSCCYEVGPELAGLFEADARPGQGDRWMLDLPAAVRRRLLSAGLLEENVTASELCTFCREDLFFSHRRSVKAGGEATGRQGMLVWLENGSPGAGQ